MHIRTSILLEFTPVQHNSSWPATCKGSLQSQLTLNPSWYTTSQVRNSSTDGGFQEYGPILKLKSFYAETHLEQ